MTTLDDIITILQDGEWHDIEEVKKECEDMFGVLKKNIEVTLEFLETYEFIEKEAKGNRVRVDKRYMTFLRAIHPLEH